MRRAYGNAYRHARDAQQVQRDADRAHERRRAAVAPLAAHTVMHSPIVPQQRAWVVPAATQCGTSAPPPPEGRL